jgi:hypothetical protein
MHVSLLIGAPPIIERSEMRLNRGASPIIYQCKACLQSKII